MVAFPCHHLPTLSAGIRESTRALHHQKITSLSQFSTGPSFFHPKTQQFFLEFPQIFPGIRDLKVILTTK